MFLISKIKLCALVWLVYIAIILINTIPVIAQEACIPCNNIPPICPSCPEGSKCILPIRTCFECPKPRCSKVSSEASPDNDKNKNLLPVVIGGILGIGFFAALGYGCFVWRRRTLNERGVKLDSNEEMNSVNSVNGENVNVIPIAYIPSTPITSKPEPTYPRLRGSNISCGTTPLASNLGDERLIDITDEDDNVGTILQATKTAPTATLMTATRAKPALFRININTIKQTANIDKGSMRNENSNPNTPKTPMTSNTFLNAPNAPSISSVPCSPISDCQIRFGCDSDTEQIMPRIDIERSSVVSFRVTNQNSKSQHLNSPLLDPIEGRQSFGLFGSDEVYSKDPSSPQLQRGSIISSSSSNGRSTMASDDGDGEIMIFWGGNAPPFVNVTGGCQNQVKKPENCVDSTQNEEIKIKESI